MYKVVRLSTILIIFMLTACNQYKPMDYTKSVQGLESEQIIEYYFSAWNEKDYEKMNAVLSDEMKAMTIDYDSINTVEIISCDLVSAEDLPVVIDRLVEAATYKVVAKYYQNEDPEQDNISTAYYYTGKDTENSPRLIYYVENDTRENP
ncbi:MAG: DUF4829 domain-containing protein [Clostridia bacterium]|nr:DUF4829 domain-containing protein [Clostridia bacterium]